MTTVRKIVVTVIVVLLVAAALAIPVLARGLGQEAPPTPDQLATVLLGIYGAILSLAFMYVPELRSWYESLPHQGVVMLGMILAVAAVYYGLSCTSFAAQLHILVKCDSTSIFDLLKAVFILAVGNQLTYLFAPTPKGSSSKSAAVAR